ncbi:MAG TPA: adenosylcobinamide-GDP ribazoletransferase [Acidimicrobiales bacterium]|nr:adenosylcobinamide-GDP ribazoletransferase [Acidimicrobiales bacterium]
MRRAISFLTPLGGPSIPSPAAVAWFPLVGLAIGLALSGVWWLASEAWPAPVAAALVVGADLVLTGLLHLDGLVDAADGLLPPLDRQRRLDVMADPAAGAFGVGAAVTVLLLRWAALAALAPSALLLPALWCASRTAMAVTTRAVPYARPGGLAESFRSPGTSKAVTLGAIGAVVAVVLGILASGLGGFVAVVACLLLAGVVVALAVRRVGGFTGDVLGAAGMVGETAGLLVAAARW